MQMAGEIPFAAGCEEQAREAREDYCDRKQRQLEWESVPSKDRVDVDGRRVTQPEDEVQKRGGMVDRYYMDDGDGLMMVVLAGACAKCFDIANKMFGAERAEDKSQCTILRVQAGHRKEQEAVGD